MASVFADVYKLSGGASVYGNVYQLAETNPAIVTTRLALVGTSRFRFSLQGTSMERLSIVGTSQKRLSIEGASR